MNTSAQTHQELAQLRRRVQIFYTAHTVLYAAALGLLVWRPARMAGLVLGVANMVFYFLWLRGQVKGYSNAVTAARTRLGVCAPLADPAPPGRQGRKPADSERLCRNAGRPEGRRHRGHPPLSVQERPGTAGFQLPERDAALVRGPGAGRLAAAP